MATAQDIERSYEFMDGILRAALGETFDFSCGLYDDKQKSLAQAQHDKHAYVLDSLRFAPEQRILDIGCGWGAMVKAIQDRGGQAVGITLSPKQVRACRRNGMSAVYLRDWRDVSPETFGTFHGIVSLGAFEHFCSVAEYRAGQQLQAYQRFFDSCHALLRPGARLHLQTLGHGERMLGFDQISLDAPKNSDAYLVALMTKLYPESWLPASQDQVVEAARGFRLVRSTSRRRDWIRTIEAWKEPKRRWSAARAWHTLMLAPKFVTDRDFRYQVECGNVYALQRLLERNVWDEWWFLFERV